MNAIQKYYEECMQELHQVRWATRQQAIRLSIIVLAFTAVATMSLGSVDFILSKVVGLLLSLVSF